MQKELQLILSPKKAFHEDLYKPIVAGKLKVTTERIKTIRILRRSIDSRGKHIRINLHLRVHVDEEEKIPVAPEPQYRDVSAGKEVVIIGSGPAGLFAALHLIELGYKPVILERGKEVSERKKDIALITREHRVNPDSNYCFGEGGAGTFSDGKLYTRSKKRGDHRRILNTLHWHGTDEAILYDAHPHIGSDKLPMIIRHIRETILNAGGQIRFNTRIDGLEIKNHKVTCVTTSGGDRFSGIAFILATGHSAREIYFYLDRIGIPLEAKPFAVGVRVEHPQSLIDTIQYHGLKRDEYLPPAMYSLIHQSAGRGVYSFCMCPGGFIIPSATAGEEVVVNGMSPSKRNSPFANSGIVIEIRPEDITEFEQFGALKGLKYQLALEQQAWIAGGKKQTAPAQRLSDFISGKASRSLPACSYTPGVVSSDLHKWLPISLVERLRAGFLAFDRKMKGFLTNEAIILGVESRTSSPVRIPRDPELLSHPLISNLFPCGEGAGFSGGIVSSAVDGERVAEKVVEMVKKK
jgi:uncharacterized FAD-dependent dehydrogenase